MFLKYYEHPIDGTEVTGREGKVLTDRPAVFVN